MQLTSVMGAPVPEGLRAGSIRTSDGRDLRYAICCDTAGARGTVCVLQGRRSFIERDYETIEDLRARGFAVATFDWRGQGLSTRPLKNRLLNHVRSFDEYDIDLETFMRQVVLPDCPPPYYVLAHSLGGNIVLRSLAKHAYFEAAMLVTPFLGFHQRVPPTLFRAVTAAFKMIGLGRMKFPGDFMTRHFASNVLTHDEVRYHRQRDFLDANRDLDLGAPTMGWLNAALRSHVELFDQDGSKPPKIPIMIVVAGDERVVCNEDIRRYAREVIHAPVVEIEGAYHEILLERDDLREQLWAAFDSFIDLHS